MRRTYFVWIVASVFVLTVYLLIALTDFYRYVYHDVVRVDDIEKLINCDFVQSYTTNSAKVVFLNQRPQSRPFRGSGNVCNICDRSLQEPYLYCSLACKVHHLMRTEGGLSKYLYDCKFLPLPEVAKGDSFELDDGQFTADSVLESPGTVRTSSGSSTSCGEVGCKTLMCTATTEIVKKKRSSNSTPRTHLRPTWHISLSLNRRKSLPHRSPLY